MMFITIYVPNFYLQAALRHRESAAFPALAPPSSQRPVALIDEQENKPVIIQLNASAEAVGVHSGMTPSQGLARCPDLLIIPRSILQETAVREILLHQAFTLTPYVEATGPGLCTVRLTDLRDLFGRVSRVIAQLAACQVTAQAGLGPTPDTSFLAAHLARPILQIDDAREFLAPLPIEILNVDVDEN